MAELAASLHKRWLAAVLVLALLPVGVYYLSDRLDAATATISPNGDVVTDWSAEGACSGSLWECVADSPSNPNENSYIRTGGNNDVAQFAMNTNNVARGAYTLTVHMYSRNTDSYNSAEDDIEVQAQMPGGNTSTQAITISESNTFTWYQASWSGEYPQSDVDNLTVSLTHSRNCSGLGCLDLFRSDTLEVAALYIEIEYEPYAELRQTGYRFYENTDSAAPGPPLASTNQPADLSTQGASFRLRMTHAVDTSDFLHDEDEYKLQVATKDGSCDTSSYEDVESTHFFENASVVDGSTVQTFTDDPDVTGDLAPQTYIESNPFSATNNAPMGNQLLWDFSLQDADATPGITYCFRMVESDGTELSQYDIYPEVTAVGDLGVGIVDSADETVSSPSFSLAPAPVMTQCQESQGILGDSSQRLRITNDLVTEGWSVNIAATNGPEALWTSDNGSYDFNDPAGSPSGCSAGNDSDIYAGLLSIDPGAGSITAGGSCSDADISMGPAAHFEEGVTDSLQLVTAGSASERFCDFYIEGIGITQTIPAEQPTGEYSIDMTVTIIAD